MEEGRVPKILQNPHDLYIDGIRVPDFMRRGYGNRYMGDPVFIQVAKWWNSDQEDKIVRSAMKTEHPITPLKEIAISILEQEKDALAWEGGSGLLVDEPDMWEDAARRRGRGTRKHRLEEQIRQLRAKRTAVPPGARSGDVPSPHSTPGIGRSDTLFKEEMVCDK